MREAPSLCRDCLKLGAVGRRCAACGRRRLVTHPELTSLTLAHIDCDAFYASIEKRDNPALRDVPVIVGGGKRGVVSAACYIARISGVHSAMPMFKALKACPDAVVIKPDMEKYVSAGREVRRLMQELTPLVEPISIDEAFLDLAGTERLHRHSAAESLAGLALRIERDIGISVSIGLSFNKFLAKVASDLDKPRGFSVIGRGEALQFLADKPVSIIWGVGKILQAKLANDGLRTIGQVRALDLTSLMARYGTMGKRLHELSHAVDNRRVSPNHESKSVSSETTFNDDIAALPELERNLWLLCEKVSRRLKKADLAGRTVTLKLKTADFRIITRRVTLHEATRLAERIFKAAAPLLQGEAKARAYRLIGVGVSELCAVEAADHGDLLDASLSRQVRVEEAMDSMRARFGNAVVMKGRALRLDDK